MELEGGERRKSISVERYVAGVFSISEAAGFANVSVGEMMDILVKRGVKVNYSVGDVEGSFERVGEFCKKVNG